MSLSCRAIRTTSHHPAILSQSRTRSWMSTKVIIGTNNPSGCRSNVEGDYIIGTIMSRRSLSIWESRRCQYRNNDAIIYSPSSGLQKYQKRPLSDTTNDNKSNNKNNKQNEKQNETEWKVLYKRTQNRTLFPRGLLALTTLHTTYWSWYVLDFTPAVNAAAQAAADASQAAAATSASTVLIDPTIGYVGLGLSSFLSLAAILYPKHLISEIRLYDDSNHPSNHELRIRTHQLPFVTLPTGNDGGGTVYPIQSISIDSERDVSQLLNEPCHGDLRNFRGHLGLVAPGLRTNLLLHLGENAEEEVKDGSLLLECLVGSGPVIGKKKSGGKLMSEEGAKSVKALQRSKRKQRTMRKVRNLRR